MPIMVLANYLIAHPTAVTGACTAVVALLTYRASKKPHINVSLHLADNVYYLHVENMSSNFARNLRIVGHGYDMNYLFLEMGCVFNRSFMGEGMISIPPMYSYRCPLGLKDLLEGELERLSISYIDVFGEGPIGKFKQRKIKFDISPISGISCQVSTGIRDGSIDSEGVSSFHLPIRK